MKKLITSLLVGATACAIVPVSGMIKANAGEKQTVFMEEQFSQDALDQSKWTKNGDSIELYADKETGYMHIARNLETHHTGIKTAIEGLEYMQFDIQFLKNKWMAMYFKPEEKKTLGDYEPEMFMNMAGDGKFSSHNLKFKFSQYVISAPMGEWMTMKFVRTSSTTMDLYVCERGGNVDEAIPTTITIENAEANFDKFYFAIAGEGGQEFSLDNIVVQSESVNINERVYGDTVNENIKAYGAPFEIVSPDSSLTFLNSNKGDGVQYNYPMEEETSIIEDLEVLKMKYTASFANANEGDAVAFAFGVAGGQTYEDYSYACVMEKDGVSLVFFENGEQTVILDKVSANLVNDTQIEVVANKNGEISLYVNDMPQGKTTVDLDVYYTGAFGFYATKDNTGSVAIDSVRMVTKTYHVPVTKSVSHNFSNDFYGNEGYEDFVWNATHEENGMYVKDGKLVYDNVADDTFFGSAHEYDNFVLDFKLCSVKVGENATGPNKWLGIDIGKNSAGKTQYGTNFLLAHEIVPTANEIGYWTYTHETSQYMSSDLNKQIVQYKKLPKAYFDAIQYDDIEKTEADILEKDALCFRYVVENGTIRMYMKRACEAEYQLYATMSGVETTGYVAITVTGWTTLTLDDFSMSNISSAYVNADSFAPETVIQENKVVIYDNNLMGDPLALEEAKANMSTGCSSVAATWGVLPLLVAGVALVKKNRKDEDQ